MLSSAVFRAEGRTELVIDGKLLPAPRESTSLFGAENVQIADKALSLTLIACDTALLRLDE